MLRTQNATQLNLTASANDPGGSRQAIALGFSVTTIKLEKNVAGRNNPADQFQLDITGTPSAQAITAGAASGIQPQVATVYAIPGNTYTINESMAPGSVSALMDYTQTVSAANSTPSGYVPLRAAHRKPPHHFYPCCGRQCDLYHFKRGGGGLHQDGR